ncbi:bifunctional diguanylate cyclase/phosphodiesterase [Cognaticolwellia mytili]|uniref:bifunctional diguanylate cyclase/phosphodiesterase n=1 Tax=Cognaticolwellia mytili TaxID=1888913 RepID=UPI000A1744F4|nr:bifunctional diguanylate cyclase/phosphodiesterase [Cognaticolwellia mytili]
MADYQFQQKTKQLAREILLSNDRLFLQNEYLQTRLRSILSQPPEQSNLVFALTKVIENADFGVIVVDANFSTIIENTAALTLFEHNSSNNTTAVRPINIITKLMKNQLPEYDRIISTKSNWDGELCWISPPSTLKWLKIGFHPVKNKLNEPESWLVFANDISTIKHLAQRNEKLALQDMLTELPNRFSFWQTLDQQIITGSPFYLLYVDINEFRRHNEFYGHQEGDKLLIDFGRRIESVIKKSDFIARVGGDEFAIILANIDNQEACKGAIERILETISKPYQTNKLESFHISVSIGAANFPNDATSVEELMKFVDLSAYSGKENKKNSLLFYSQEIKDASHHLIKVEQELRQAINQEEFELFLQPIVDLESHSISKAEALIRWNHPTKGLISPDKFIPIAEKSGLIITIGEWVIKRACQMIKEINAKGHNVIISINLSPSQVIDENLFSYLHSCIKTSQVEPSSLELEVTEGVLVDDYSIAKRLLNNARAIGITVSVDDFGTGYSSLAYLKKLPLDFLKIDRSFIKDIVADENDKAIVRAVIAMAHNLKLSVISEGVETEEQLKFLIKNSCNSVQGYLFSRPVQLEYFLDILKEQW